MKSRPLNISEKREEFLIHGIPASPGVAIGSALVIRKAEFFIEEKNISPEDIPGELSKFKEAIEVTRKQIISLQNRVQSMLNKNDARIFDAHLLILDDKMLMEEVEAGVAKELRNIDFVFNRTVQRYIAAISAMPDPYLRERAQDIRDVAERIIKNLHSRTCSILDRLPGQRIIVAHEVTPSDTADMDKENVQAFATEVGGKTSHSAIMARAMQIPAVVGAQNLFLDTIHNGDLLIIDGYLGMIIVNPRPNTLKVYADKESEAEKYYSGFLKETRLWPETIDGFRIQLAANIQGVEGVEDAKRHGAAGIGLFRTEYLFINAKELPSEEKQFSAYSKIASDMEGHQVVIRTFDLGGDKLSEVITPFNEPNPFLGFRAVRLFLEYPHFMKTQLRAILRASAFGNVKIMFPMISGCEELDRLTAILEECKKELRVSGIPHNDNIDVGIMIEIPSAAIMADSLAKKVKFFSIGTNDLVQYTIAVDRTNEKVAHLYQPTHPAVLHLIKNVVSAAKANGIWVSVCGEMASDPRYAPILIGLGVNELSMSPGAIGPVRRLIRRMKMHEAEKIASSVLLVDDAKEALRISEEMINSVAPDIVRMSFKGI